MRKVLVLLFVLNVLLCARENPFEPTQTYLSERSQLVEIEVDRTPDKTIELEENYPIEFQAKKKVFTKETPKIDLKDKNVTSDIKVVEKQNDINKSIKTETIEEVVTNGKKIKPKQEEIKVVEVKKIEPKKIEPKIKKIFKIVSKKTKPKFKQLDKGTHKILPFLTIVFDDSKMQIQSKYSVFKKFSIDEQNKIVFDYHGNTRFFTKRFELDSTHFKKIIIGNHRKDRFFRIVLILNKKPDNYKSTYTDYHLVTVVVNN